MFLSLIFHSKSCIQNCLNSSIRDTVLVTTATITISNIFFLRQGSSHNNIAKLQSDNIRDKKIIFLVLDPLKVDRQSPEFFFPAVPVKAHGPAWLIAVQRCMYCLYYTKDEAILRDSVIFFSHYMTAYVTKPTLLSKRPPL